MTLVLDSGALIALERNDRAMWRRLKAAHLAASVPISHGGVIGQVWRGRGPRQSLLARALDGIDVRALDVALGPVAGRVAGAPHDVRTSSMRLSCCSHRTATTS